MNWHIVLLNAKFGINVFGFSPPRIDSREQESSQIIYDKSHISNVEII